MQQNPQVYYVNKEVFYSCYQQIRNLLDISALLDFLKKYDMVHDSEAMHALTSPHRLADYFSSLNNLVESQGEYGYMLLYMCIHESSVSSTWHTEAVAKLNMMGMYVCMCGVCGVCVCGVCGMCMRACVRVCMCVCMRVCPCMCVCMCVCITKMRYLNCIHSTFYWSSSVAKLVRWTSNLV